MMQKRDKIIYWVSTLWLSLGMVSTGLVQLLKVENETKFILQLGYPAYFLTILGVSKLLGVVAVLIPKFPLLKEWAYAGFVFTMTGAVFSHFANGDSAKDFFGPTLLLLLTIVSWYFRPSSRKLLTIN